MTAPQREPVAIIGTGCRFPGSASSPSKLWDLLKQPKDLMQEIPSSRFNAQGHYHPDNTHHGTSNVQHSYLLDEDHRHFDAQFFGIKPVEANSIDPQQRLLMETVYESIESAGLKIEELQGSQTAVYVGLMCGDYSDMLMQSPDSIPMYMATGTARSIMANRISYFFDWHGPCMTIDTACSSSLVALHHAVAAVRSGESRAAVAAGSNLCLNPEPYIAESKLKMLSPTGRSRMWDSQADGYARGDGVASVIVKTLSAALEDGDHIECIVRETGVNQDGRTKGITMPSSVAQAQLIRQTYARAGLDINHAKDRPQYFEAHGTGTPTGDPLEASAIASTFFPKGSNQGEKLYVGSIKTVVGHTEGTAGIAGIIKASLAIQHSYIPPNLHFNALNPAIEPHYKSLTIPTALTKWPAVETRRASVNSFGFGGTNAHAILEAYSGPQPSLSGADACFTPLTLSAHTEPALLRMVESLVEYLKENPGTSLRDLAFTLNARRSSFAHRTAFPAISPNAVVERVEQHLQDLQDGKVSVGNADFRKATPTLLGVFTGQGAQWAQMGKSLIISSPAVAAVIDKLEARLAELPESDRPQWSLKEELLKDAKSSRLSEAALSQPLCTAVQVALVDLLHATGLSFTAVVGHSSGEIAAAYAAGFISDTDAIVIAYYRGLYSRLAQGTEGVEGKMMAIGTSEEDAQELCEMPEFEGRIGVAAVNSSSSITLSGDADAIQQAKDILDDEKKFARLLAVDKAYHSHHMIPCSDAYERALNLCQIEIRKPSNSCTWYSSVDTTPVTASRTDLAANYWVANMLQPVKFRHAVELACNSIGAFDMAIEVGPHPALKGPATQTIGEVLDTPVTYTTLLKRGVSATEAFASGLADLWTQFGSNHVALDRVFAHASGGIKPSLVKGLPAYSWQHDRVFWHESRAARIRRLRSHAPNQILGNRDPNDPDRQFRWTNTLSPSEIPYLADHKIQNQMVFPAAGYVSAAVEAAMAISKGQDVSTVELRNMNIGQAMSFDEMDSKVNILVAVSELDHRDSNVVAAQFHFFSTSNSDTMTLNADGELLITYGSPTIDALPSRSPRELEMIDIDDTRFYASLDALGYGYSGAFRSLSNLKRKLHKASGNVLRPPTEDPTELFIHPATLDATIQSVMLAASWPGDGRLWSLHVPTRIESICVNPFFCKAQKPIDGFYGFDTVITKSHEPGLNGDFQIFAKDGKTTLLRMEGMHAVPLEGATATGDRKLFTRMDWYPAHPDAEVAVGTDRATTYDYRLAELLERVATYYYSRLEDSFPHGHPAREEGQPWARMLDFCSHVVEFVGKGQHVCGRPDWIDDDEETIEAEMAKFEENIDLRVMRIIGKNLASVVRGESNMLEHLRVDDILDDYYSKAMGTHYAEYVGRIGLQLAEVNPHLKFLEIGAGTGSATKPLMRLLDGKYSSYTFTDISSGFFEKAGEVFAKDADKMTFKVLDVEKDIPAQGFAPQSFDVIVASFVLHATKNLDHTMRQVRQLLKPGGYLLLLEITNLRQARLGFIFGSLSGWWLGEDEGRRLTPLATKPKWDTILRRTGFSGIDTVTPDQDELPFPVSVLVSQAVDPVVEFLRDPLFSASSEINDSLKTRTLLMIGGASQGRLNIHVRGLLGAFYSQVSYVNSVDDITESLLGPSTTALVLEDLDRHVFEGFAAKTLDGLRRLLDKIENILWVTREAHNNNPYHMMSTGFGRAMSMELPHIRTQFLDLDRIGKSAATEIAENVLRLEIHDPAEASDESKQLLWSTEPEIMIRSEQKLLPRVHRDDKQNDRYNSFRRLVQRKVQIRDEPVRLTSTVGVHSAVALVAPLGLTADMCAIDVHQSTLNAVNAAGNADLHLIQGNLQGSNQQVIALSEANSSLAYVSKDVVVHVKSQSQQLLQAVQHAFFALNTLDGLHSGDSLMIVEPSSMMVAAFRQAAIGKAITMRFLTSNRNSRGAHYTHIHGNAGISEISALAASCSSQLLCLGKSKQLENRLIPRLPSSCRVERIEHLLSTRVHKIKSARSQQVSQLLQRAVSVAESLPQSLESEGSTIALSALANRRLRSDDVAVLDWTSESTATINVEAVDRYEMLKGDRTYWLLGLSRNLGLSLCRWLISHGARHIVISSRTPNVDRRLLKELEDLGAVVKVYACNISSAQSVVETYNLINKTMPQIAGVANGAMVLRDTLLSEMSIEDMNAVIEPKVNGSIHLNSLFQEDTLDFFIFFSSAIGVTGNVGQSNYAIANTFMHGLAAQRRSKGLAASAIVIGVILGVGYVTRETTQALQDNLLKSGHTWMSEEDFHCLFAEAIVAGQSDKVATSEIISGLKMIDVADGHRPPWSFNPKFNHLVTSSQSIHDADAEKSGRVPLKTQLLEANSKEEVYSSLQEGLIAKVRLMLQLNESMSSENILKFTSEDLGIDSLNAVDLRTWFVKDVKVDIPVLRILGGSSMTDILQYAFEQLTPETAPAMDPNFKPKATTKSSTPKAAVQKNVQADAPKAETPRPQAPAAAPAQVRQPVAGPVKTASVKISAPPVAPSQDLSNSAPSDTSTADSYEVINSSASSVHSEPETHPKKVVPAIATPEELDLIESSDLVHGQARFLFLQNLVKDKTSFNITCAFDITGRLDTGKLAKAVQTVTQRHKALRTCFQVRSDGQPYQAVMKTSRTSLELSSYTSEEDLDRAFQQHKNHIFDLAQGDLMRIELLSSTMSDTRRLIVAYHHINMDGVSLGIILDELERAYKGQTLAPADVFQYPEYAVQQKNKQDAGAWTSDIAYWRKEVGASPAILPILPFATAKQRSNALSDYLALETSAKLDKVLTSKIHKVCASAKISPFHFFTTIFHSMLARLTQVSEVMLGFTDANRYESRLEKSVGSYLNILPIKLKYSPEQRFLASAKDARKKITDAILHSSAPVDVIVDELGVARSASYNPLFQACINYRPAVNERRPFADCILEGRQYVSGRTAYDVLLDIIDSGLGDTTVIFSVQASLYDQTVANTLARSFVSIVKAFVENPQLALSQPSLFDDADVSRTVSLGSGPTTPSQWPETVVHRVDDISLRSPGKTAIKDARGNRITYEELVARASSIAKILRTNTAEDKPRVGVYQRATIDWICSMLAIMRIGGTYVPLDSRYSTPRLRNIIGKCKPAAIIYDAQTIGLRSELGADNITAIDLKKVATSRESMEIQAKASDWACILYTSGSTGEPKGIPLSHRCLLTNYEASLNIFGITDADVVLQQTAFSFDLSMWQTLVALSAGATLFIVPDELRRDAPRIVDLIRDHGITLTGGVPSEYVSWFQFGDEEKMSQSSWRAALCGGEPMSVALQQHFQSLHKGDLVLRNVYGPTECSLYSTTTPIAYEVPDAAVSVGTALPNFHIWIVNDENEIVPPGVLGQIVIGGPAVATEYVDNAQQTRERFSSELVAAEKHLGKKSGPVHLSGDQGWIDEQGHLFIKGRLTGDTQIKLRGQRMDLREVEQAIELAGEGRILEALVTVRKPVDTELEFLVAHVRLDESKSLFTESGAQELIASLPLPSYMKPSALIPISEFPMTDHGKRDRSAISQLALPEKTAGDEQTGAIVDLTDAEIKVLDVWRSTIPSEAFAMHNVTPQSDFFLIGGNSIQLLALQAKLKAISGVQTPLVKLFEHSTLKAMATLVSSEDSVSTGEVVDWDTETALTVSSEQTQSMATPTAEGLTVVLTGSTGFLGQEMLRQLTSDANIKKVHCIAVRSPSKLGTFARSSKLVVHGGDLTLPDFGLREDAVESVFGEAHFILHNGAEVSFMKSYQSLRQANVESTKQLIRLSHRFGGLPIHYVSTAGVGWLSGKDEFGEVSVAELRPPTDGSNGYVASKWASERLLEEASKAYDLAVSIYRPSNITGEGVPEQDVMDNIVRFSRRIKAAPYMGKAWDGFLNFISVEASATMIVENICPQTARATGGINYVNVVSDEQIAVDELKEWLEKTDVPSWYKVMPLNRWIDRVEAAGMDPLVAAYLRQMEVDYPTVKLSKLVKAQAPWKQAKKEKDQQSHGLAFWRR